MKSVIAHTISTVHAPAHVQHSPPRSDKSARHTRGAVLGSLEERAERAERAESPEPEELVELAQSSSHAPSRRIRRYPECGMRHTSICSTGGAFIRAMIRHRYWTYVTTLTHGDP